MQWTPGGVSGDIEDRRGDSGGPGFGGFGRLPIGIGGTLLLLVLSVIFGQDFLGIFSGAPAPAPASGSADRSQPVEESPGEHREVQFVSFVLDDVQKTWEAILPRSGTPYRHAKLVLFRGMVQAACGMAEAATGPFYCPADEKVYIDLGFYDELKSRFGAPGEFAQAYVIAHEIGHHVQKLLGIESRARRLQAGDPQSRNQVSVRLELQADCLAGVWGHSTEQRGIIDRSDVAAGLNAAAAIGDDRLQRMTRGYAAPETFTHGSSEQRVQWFRTGLESGQVGACDTFAR